MAAKLGKGGSVEKPETCIKCHEPLRQPATGHPRWYCSPACRRSGEFEIRRIQQRLQKLEDMLVDQRHLDSYLTAQQRRNREREIGEYELV